MNVRHLEFDDVMNSRHMPAQQSPRFKLVQAIVQAKPNLGQPSRVFHIGNKLLLRRADAALAMRFYFQGVKTSAVQQDQIGHARLDTKTDKPCRLDMAPPTAIGRMKKHSATHSTRVKVLHDGAVYVGFIKRH
jgi:hypothetical protein